MTAPGGIAAAALEAAVALTCAARPYLRGERIEPVAYDGDVVLSPFDTGRLSHALAERADTRAAERAASLLATHGAAGPAAIPVGKAWALVRLLNAAARGHTRPSSGAPT